MDNPLWWDGGTMAKTRPRRTIGHIPKIISKEKLDLDWVALRQRQNVSDELSRQMLHLKFHMFFRDIPLRLELQLSIGYNFFAIKSLLNFIKMAWLTSREDIWFIGCYFNIFKNTRYRTSLLLPTKTARLTFLSSVGVGWSSSAHLLSHTLSLSIWDRGWTMFPARIVWNPAFARTVLTCSTMCKPAEPSRRLSQFVAWMAERNCTRAYQMEQKCAWTWITES